MRRQIVLVTGAGGFIGSHIACKAEILMTAMTSMGVLNLGGLFAHRHLRPSHRGHC
jgi:FlaA1/EpsC-like NDP-sugar epimerase